jgi:S1-C subfamily serine protease
LPIQVPERLRVPLALLAGCGIALVAMFAYLKLDPQEGRYEDSDIRRLASEQIASVTPEPPIEPQVYALIRPAVVLITRDADVPNAATGRGLGSGVVFDLNGSILTAYHVVAGTERVTVRFYDGTMTTGTVVQEQPDRDLAVVQVARLPNSVQPAVLGGGVEHGSRVMAIGAPFGLEGSTSLGVVSGLNRRFTVESTGRILENMIQFDAAVNPGNSGGPLVDMNGQVVGIVSGIINPTGSSVFIGLGFAVPIQAASGIVAPVD